MSQIPYQTKTRWTKLSKFLLGVENFVRPKILSVRKFLSNISIQKSGKNRTKLSKFLLGVENFVRQKILSVEDFVQYYITKVRHQFYSRVSHEYFTDFVLKQFPLHTLVGKPYYISEHKVANYA